MAENKIIDFKSIAERYSTKPVAQMFPKNVMLIAKGLCVSCESEILVFNDKISQDEYAISGMCQKCQDEVYKPKKINYDKPKCDYCDKDAILNRQECVVVWFIRDDGSYDVSDPEINNTGESVHYCAYHYRKEVLS